MLDALQWHRKNAADEIRNKYRASYLLIWLVQLQYILISGEAKNM